VSAAPDRRALVTGASSGIGEAFARALAARGERLVLVARRAERLQALVEQLGGSAAALALPRDLAQAGAARALADDLAARGIAVELLVNNAGIGTTGPFSREDPSVTASILALNVRASVELTRVLVEPMLARGRGRIINVVSMSAFQPVPYLATYAATKAYLLSFSESLAAEVRGRGVQVQALCPGLVHTEFQQKAGTDRVRFNRVPSRSPLFVAEKALDALDSGRVVVIPDWRDRMSVFAQRLLPRALVSRVGAWLFEPPQGGVGQ
jgi:short-subunit dehydrogenase